MIDDSLLPLAPLLVISTIQLFRYQGPEKADSLVSPRLLQAAAAIALAILWALLRVLGIVVPYGAIVLGAGATGWLVYVFWSYRRAIRR